MTAEAEKPGSPNQQKKVKKKQKDSRRCWFGSECARGDDGGGGNSNSNNSKNCDTSPRRENEEDPAKKEKKRQSRDPGSLVEAKAPASPKQQPSPGQEAIGEQKNKKGKKKKNCRFGASCNRQPRCPFLHPGDEDCGAAAVRAAGSDGGSGGADPATPPSKRAKDAGPATVATTSTTTPATAKKHQKKKNKSCRFGAACKKQPHCPFRHPGDEVEGRGGRAAAGSQNGMVVWATDFEDRLLRDAVVSGGGDAPRQDRPSLDAFGGEMLMAADFEDQLFRQASAIASASAPTNTAVPDVVDTAMSDTVGTKERDQQLLDPSSDANNGNGRKAKKKQQQQLQQSQSVGEENCGSSDAAQPPPNNNKKNNSGANSGNLKKKAETMKDQQQQQPTSKKLSHRQQGTDAAEKLPVHGEPTDEKKDVDSSHQSTVTESGPEKELASVTSSPIEDDGDGDEKETEAERKRRRLEELRRQKERAVEKADKKKKKKDRYEQLLREQERKEEERIAFWQGEIELENQVVGLIERLLAAEFCRVYPTLDTIKITEDSTAKEKLVTASRQAFRALFSVHSRVMIAGLQKEGLDGRSGMIQFWDESKGKFNVAVGTKKGKSVYKFIAPANLDATKSKASPKGRVFIVSIDSVLPGLDLETSVEKKIISEMKSVPCVVDYLNKLMQRRFEADLAAKFAVQEQQRLEKEERRRRREEMQKEQMRAEANRARRQRERAAAKERRREARGRYQHSANCRCPLCMAERYYYFEEMFGGFFHFFEGVPGGDNFFDDDDDDFTGMNDEERARVKEEAAELLGVSPDASPAEIKRAYRQSARKYHPDSFCPSKHDEEITKEEAEERFKRISNAHTIMMEEFENDPENID